MKPRYSTTSERIQTLITAPILFVFGREEALVRMRDLKPKLSELDGRVDALDLHRQALNDCIFFGFTAHLAGFSRFGEMSMTAKESLSRYVDRMRRNLAKFCLFRRVILRIPEPERSFNDSDDLEFLNHEIMKFSGQYRSAHKALLEFHV